VRVITVNANGLRSAARKGLLDWLAAQEPDLVCLQETRSQEHQLGPGVALLGGLRGTFLDAQRKGYSGVAIYSTREPSALARGIGDAAMDTEGRYLQADFECLSVVSLYVPSGSSGPERQAFKYRFLDRLYQVLREKVATQREYIICGDWNIAHRPIDLKNWRANQKNSGFLPEERAWLDRLFDELGLVDAFRLVNAEPGEYTWWSNRGRAREKNVGWRIDYQVITPGLKAAVTRATIYRERRFSDHAPLLVDYALDWPGPARVGLEA
jgi:exodeoxyribonuclease-3